MPALLALIPIVHALIGGASIGAILGGLSLAQWFSLAGALADAEPAVVVAVQALHPAFEKLVEDIGTIGPQHAANTAWRTRQPQFISGYDGSGALVDNIPNPDYLES